MIETLVVDARQADPFEKKISVHTNTQTLFFSKTADLLGFKGTAIYRVYIEWIEREK